MLDYMLIMGFFFDFWCRPSSAQDMQMDSEVPDELPETTVGYDDKNDLCNFIPGLNRLLDLCKDEGSNGLGKESSLKILSLCWEILSSMI